MFTFGIFSTHIPYVAFLLFYAFFFMPASKRASAGGFETDALHNPEIISSSAYKQADGCQILYTGSSILEIENNSELLSNLKIKARIIYSPYVFFASDYYKFSCFSRPPPVD